MKNEINLRASSFNRTIQHIPTGQFTPRRRSQTKNKTSDSVAKTTKCKMKKQNHVWEFTNQRKLSKSEFINYFERKVFRTIRKHKMIDPKKNMSIKKSTSLNTKVLKSVLEKKFQVAFSTKPTLSADNLSQVAEDSFKNILQGKFTGPRLDNKPLNQTSDKEVELYAKLKNIKGKKRIKDKKVQSLFEKFLKKNQDLELNVVKAINQIS